MKRFFLIGLVVVAAAAGFAIARLLATSPAPPPALDSPAAAAEGAQHPFPLVSRFELPRRYGYFIGDPIPLTLVLETRAEVVVDLVNLPRRGEKHGLFEVREVTLTTHRRGGHKVYRAHYTLQYFGATPLDVEFAPLEILYARADTAPGGLRYRRLLTQPVIINISRLGPYRPTPPMDIKGPLPARRAGLGWGGLALGVALLGTAGGQLGWRWWRRRRQQAEYQEPTPLEKTLQRLQQEVAALRPPPVSPLPLSTRLGDLLREFLQAAYGVPAFALTPSELAARLPATPACQKLIDLLQQCDGLKYRQPGSSEPDAQGLLWEALLVFEKLQQGRSP
ncbi:MAG: hypothetical protein KatS3mg131_3229 [Candidatus Tectimicrobiota bacterium]|nr:MAG: hypothetical protein KatS3mg131_3229 [Candidatus Tectomicrobia bacterium]